MMYSECIEELSNILNTPRDKKKIDKFNLVIDNLNQLGFNISTKFIRNLLSNSLTNRQKTFKIRNLIYRSKFTIERITKHFKGWVGMSWKTDIKDYSYKKDYILTEYDRVNQLNINRIDNIKLNISTSRIGNSFIGIQKEVYYFLV